MREEIELIQNRMLKECYAVIYCIETSKFGYKNQEGIIKNSPMYIFYGIDLKGKRQYLSHVLKDKYEKVSEWYGFFEKLKDRGVKVIIYASLPENEQITKGLKLSFKEIEIWKSCHGVLEKIFKYFSNKQSRRFEQVIFRIYNSETIEEYEMNYTEYKREFEKYKYVIDMVDKELQEVKELYRYSSRIRKLIYNFYYIRQFKREVEVVINSRPYFHSEMEFLEAMVERIKTSEKLGFNVIEWADTLTEIYEEKGPLIKDYM